MLPCIAAVAIATFVGTKAFKSNASGSNALLMANVEALSLRESATYSCEAEADCIICGKKEGSVKCTGTANCTSGSGYVICDGKKSECGG